MKTRQHGFTLWELLMTLLVAGVLLGIGVPNVMELQRNGQMVAAANDLLTATLSARSEAIKRQRPVVLCLSDTTQATPTCSPNAVVGASLGFIVWVDEDNDGVRDAGEQLLMQGAAPREPIRVSANCGHVGYAPNGWARPIAGAPCAPAVRTVLFCDDRGRRATSGQISSARAVRIDATGRGQVQQELADVVTAIGAIGGPPATCP